MIILELGQRITRQGRTGTVTEVQMMPGHPEAVTQLGHTLIIAGATPSYQRARVEWDGGGWMEGASRIFVEE